MKKLMLQAGFVTALAAVLVLGIVLVSSPASAKPAPGPITDCPYLTCSSIPSGWVHDGTCDTDYGHGCVEVCNVYRNPSNGSRCKLTTNCAWQ